jgi:L-2,4-diaminobutyrate decarboxylase
MNDSAGPMENVKEAYSAATFAAAAEIWQQTLSGHLQRVTAGNSRVLNWNEPASAIQLAEEILHSGNENSGQSLTERFQWLLNETLARGQNLHHPHYIGHQVPASVPLAGLFDAIGSVTNQVMAIYEMGPWSTAVEHALVRTLCRKVGWNADSSTGLLTHGGSLANLTALLTARNVVLPQSWEHGTPANAVLVAHADAHYCVTRSAGILGLGTRQVVRARLDSRRRMCPNALDDTLSRLRRDNQPVIAVSACACATPIGAFDPLKDIADVCQRHDVWLHVDAAHGGSLLMSRRLKHILDGIDQADSVVWDAHKMLFVPALCAAVLYRDKAHRFETFRQDAPYLFDPSEPGMAEIDSGMRTIECTKRAAGFGLWGLWSLMGERVFEEMVDHVCQLGQDLHNMLQEAPDFEPLHVPECNIVVFRHIPRQLQDTTEESVDRFQRTLRLALIRSGQFYIVQTQLDGHAALRVAIMNPVTTQADLCELIDTLRSMGKAQLAELQSI